MKRIMLILVMGVSLSAMNAFAAGDLIVNGKLGVGTSAPIAKTGISGINETRTLHVDNELNQGVGGDFIMGAEYTARLAGSAKGSVYGFSGILNLMTTADTARSLYGASFIAQIGRSDTPGTTAVNETVGFEYSLNRHYNNQRTYNIENSYGVRTAVAEGSAVGASVNLTNHYHQYAVDPGSLTTVNISNLAGFWIEKQTSGTSNNYGLVLDGDGAIGNYGSAVVLGANQNAYLYGKTDGVYVYDGTAETKISPHDPETGEWIYYSKNIKTGKIVRVDMAKLVKAVEKLTGEVFMVETLIEE